MSRRTRGPRSARGRRRSERIDLLRDCLIEALGNICANWQRGCLLPGEDLEIDHMDGCTWGGDERRRMGREARIIRYVEEYRSGVRLQLLCKSCNRDQGRPGPELEEAPF